MKQLLRLSLLLAVLGSCSKKDPAPLIPDPLLGHWQSDSMTFRVYDANGMLDPTAINGQSSLTNPASLLLDVTATTLTFGSGVAGITPTTSTYTRSGKIITFPNQAPTVAYAVRSLTATSFTYEVANIRADGSRFVSTSPYHR